MKNKEIRTSLTIKYSIVQGLYWMIYCATYGFASSFLIGNHFENKVVGIITAIANIFAVFLQPYLGNLVDKVQNITIKKLITILAIWTLALEIAILFTAHLNQLVLAILFTIANILMLTLQPLINSLIYEYINRGIEVNYGATRGIGSLSYAIISYVLGQLLGKGAMILPFVAAVLCAFFIMVIQLFPTIADAREQKAKEEAAEESYLDFLKKYKALFPFLIAIVFVYVTHTYINMFMLQILDSLGGNNSQLGTATLISALSELPIMFAFSYIVKRIKGSTLLKWSAVFYVIRCLLMLLASNVTTIYISQLLQSLSFAIFAPASVYYINELVSDDDKVKGQTIMVGATTLGSVIGSFTGGIILDNTSVKSMLITGLFSSAMAVVFYVIASKRDHLEK